jgi:dTDP-glucose 4,6-dehydratase
VRDWIYVEDHCAGLVMAAKNGSAGEVYNLGASDEKHNLDVVKIICEILGELLPVRKNQKINLMSIQQYEDLITFVTDRPGHDRRYAIDSTKAQNALGWKPEVNFREGMLNTVKWYLDHDVWVSHIISGEYQKWIERNYSWRIKEN